MKKQLVAPALLVLMLVGAVFMGWLESRKAGGLDAQQPAPAFSGQRIDGSQVALSKLQGRVVLLTFWATWCDPCIEEMPMLVKLAGEYDARGVTWVAMNEDEPDSQLAALGDVAFAPARPYVVLDTTHVAEQYNVTSLPTSYLINRQGHIASVIHGVADEAKLRASLDALLR